MAFWKKLAASFGRHGTLEASDVIAREQDYLESAYGKRFDQQHVDYAATDYAAFVEQQYPEYVRKNYPDIDPDAYPLRHRQRPWYGLALSGGGIRSASFAIGVIQGLRNRSSFGNKPTPFDKVAYLSTASGGGYTGSALTWYQKIHNLFPFGDVRTFAGSQQSQDPENRVLSYIRQHGKYLTPSELGITGLVGAALLSVLHSIVAYTLLFSLVMLCLTAVVSSDAVNAVLDLSIVNDSSLRTLLEEVPRTLVNMKQEIRDGHVDMDKIGFSAFFISVSLLLAAGFVLTIFTYGLTSFSRHWFSRAHCYRVKVQALLGRLLVLTGASVFLAALPLAVIFVFGAEFNVQDKGFFGSLISGLVGIVMSVRSFRQKTEKAGNGSGLINTVVTGTSILIFIFFIFLFAYILGESIHDYAVSSQNWLWPIVLVLATLVVPVLVNINEVSPHKMYRDRLLETFLKAPKVAHDAPLCDVGREANNTTLASLADGNHWSPYHLVNCNIILNNATTPRFRGRVGDSFTLSPLYCGSDATGFLPTPEFASGEMTLATAMSVSGAAENPHAGVAGQGSSVNPFMAFLLTFFGLRLGYWAFNPASRIRKVNKLLRPNYVFPGLYSLLNFGHAEKSMFIELSDGGHFDNTGIYELVRRRTPVIILSDGSADPTFSFDDLGNAVERIRVDFGVLIRFFDPRFDLSGLLPGSQTSVSGANARIYDEKYGLSERGYALGDIVYPDTADEKAFVGRFIYIKTALTRNLPEDLYAYKAAYSDFPDQPTTDQFFDERQFEAYRELGYQLTRQMLSNSEARALMP